MELIKTMKTHISKSGDEAPWGGDQSGKRDCRLVLSDSGEKYIIGKEEFFETYEMCD